MNRLLFGLLFPLPALLLACSFPDEEETWLGAFRCEPDVVFDAWRRGGELRIDLMDIERVLALVPETEPERFIAQGIEAWFEGGTARLRLGARLYECPPDETILGAVERGVDYRAIGQEPGWFLEIFNNDRFELHFDYGGQVARLSWSAPRDTNGGQRYTVESDTARLEVRVDVAPCFDAMSGQPYPDTVTVLYRDATLERELQGCGRPLAAGN